MTIISQRTMQGLNLAKFDFLNTHFKLKFLLVSDSIILNTQEKT